MTEVTATAAAMHLRPMHAETIIFRRFDGTFGGIVETRPAGAAFELLLGDEERLPATGTKKRAGTFFVVERATPRPFGAMAAHHIILLWREKFPPLCIRMGHCEYFGVHGACLPPPVIAAPHTDRAGYGQGYLSSKVRPGMVRSKAAPISPATTFTVDVISKRAGG
jgi:hypothetical protein